MMILLFWDFMVRMETGNALGMEGYQAIYLKNPNQAMQRPPFDPRWSYTYKLRPWSQTLYFQPHPQHMFQVGLYLYQ